MHLLWRSSIRVLPTESIGKILYYYGFSRAEQILWVFKRSLCVCVYMRVCVGEINLCVHMYLHTNRLRNTCESIQPQINVHPYRRVRTPYHTSSRQPAPCLQIWLPPINLYLTLMTPDPFTLPLNMFIMSFEASLIHIFYQWPLTPVFDTSF